MVYSPWSIVNWEQFMKLSIMIFSILTSLFLATNVLASAVIIDAKGKVLIKTPDKNEVSVNIGQELANGTLIKTKKNASASIMLNNGTIAEIQSNQEYIVGKPSKTKQEKTIVQGLALAMNEATSTEAGPTVHGMVKMTRLGPGAPQAPLKPIGGKAALRGEYPVNISIFMPKKIIFTWNKDAKIKFSNPVLVIDDKNKEHLLVRRINPKSNTLKVSICSCKFLPGQKYSWYFASKTKDNIKGKTRRFNFKILSKSAEKKIKKDLAAIDKMKISKPGKDFLKGQLYFRANMYDKMVATLLPLWKNNKTALLKKELFIGYKRLGNTEQAAKFQ